MTSTCVRTLHRVHVILACSAMLLLCLVPTTVRASTPIIPTGKWYIEANGYLGVLEVTSIDIVGNLTGNLSGTPITGFWDGYERRMIFETSTASVAVQIYTGYLLREGPGSAVLAGSFEAFSGTGGTAVRNVYGWRAESFNTQDGSLVAAEAPAATPFPASVDIVANGQQGSLTVTSVNATNELSGTLFGKPIMGFWNPFERKLTFLWYGSLIDAAQLRLYTGYLIGSSTCLVEKNCGFAGSFEAFSGSGGEAQRNVLGWYAAFAKSA